MRTSKSMIAIGTFGALGAVAGVLAAPTAAKAGGECIPNAQWVLINEECDWHPFWWCDCTNRLDPRCTSSQTPC